MNEDQLLQLADELWVAYVGAFMDDPRYLDLSREDQVRVVQVFIRTLQAI